MKKTLMAVAMAAIITTGANAKPASHNPPKPHNDNHPVQIVNNHNHSSKPGHHAAAPRHHSKHHAPAPKIVQVRPTPPPPPPAHHHHHHSHFDFGDALIAFAILATAF